MVTTKHKAKSQPEAFPMGDLIGMLFGQIYDLESLPPHMQALVAITNCGVNLDDKQRGLFGAGFVLALQMAKIVGVLISYPGTKDTVVKTAVKAEVRKAAQGILGMVECPETGNDTWDHIESVFWNGGPLKAAAGQ